MANEIQVMKENITELETNKADKTEIPDLAGYATEGYVDAEAKTPFDSILFGGFDNILRMLGLKELLSMFYTIIYCITTSLSIF